MATSTKKKIAKKRAAHARARGARKREFPAHLGATPEEWRALKRTEWREVTQAIARYTYGSAYVPAGSALYQLQILAGQVTEAIEAPDWIAW